MPCLSNFCINSDKHPANYCVIFYGSEVISVLSEAEVAIFEHYQSICEENRFRFGKDFTDEWSPIITKQSEMVNLVQPKELFIQQTFGSDTRVVGLLLECSWEQSLGLAVMFVNEALQEVGPQDIVL